MSLFPRKMSAAILVAQKEPLVIDQVDLPQALGYGQVLVRVHFSGICGSQLGEIDGVKGPDGHLPHLLGHEGSGVVVAVGEGVRHVNVDDHVVMHWMKGAGILSEVPQYSWRGKPLNAGWVTTFNEYAIVSGDRLTRIPKDFDLKLAALFGCAVTTGLGVINNKAGLQIGQSVVILGAGGVGLNVVQGAAMVSAYPIVAVDLYDSRLELAKKLGATHGFSGRLPELEQALRSVVGEAGADVVIDNTGVPAMIELAYRLTRSEGRTVLVGVMPKDKTVSLHTLPLHFGKELTGTKGGECVPQLDIPRYVRLYQAGRLKIDEFITEKFPLKNINDAIGRIRRGETVGRCLIDMES